MLLFIVSILLVTQGTIYQEDQNMLPRNPKPIEKQSSSIILLDLLIDQQGKVTEVKLTNDKKYNNFNQFALLRARKLRFPIKEENGQAIAYWVIGYEMPFTVKAMSSIKK